MAFQSGRPAKGVMEECPRSGKVRASAVLSIEWLRDKTSLAVALSGGCVRVALRRKIIRFRLKPI
jgi:hypothetical protein